MSHYTQKELLSLAKETKDGSQLYDSIFIIPRRQLHDSGYKMMYVIGAICQEGKEREYYLLQTFSDVIDFGEWGIFGEHKEEYFHDLHLDISPNGIIHIWSNNYGKKNVKFKCHWLESSSCILEPVEV